MSEGDCVAIKKQYSHSMSMDSDSLILVQKEAGHLALQDWQNLEARYSHQGELLVDFDERELEKVD